MFSTQHEIHYRIKNAKDLSPSLHILFKCLLTLHVQIENCFYFPFFIVNFVLLVFIIWISTFSWLHPNFMRCEIFWTWFFIRCFQSHWMWNINLKKRYYWRIFQAIQFHRIQTDWGFSGWLFWLRFWQHQKWEEPLTKQRIFYKVPFIGLYIQLWWKAQVKPS